MDKHKKRILFYRDYRGYTGGHQKVADYISHSVNINFLSPLLSYSAPCRIKDSIFSAIEGVEYQSRYDPSKADIIFLAGMDWEVYLENKTNNQPVVNLIQHVRHADSREPLFKFLAQPAIRICVSDVVAQAIKPHANGPIYTIPLGTQIPQLRKEKNTDLFILANKNKELGKELYQWAEAVGLSVRMQCQPIEKKQIWEMMAASRITLCLPNKSEGFYIPSLEAMKLSDWAIVPWCEVNKIYSGRWVNLSTCRYQIEEIKRTIMSRVYKMENASIKAHRFFGKLKVEKFCLAKEQKLYSRIMMENFA